MEIIHYIGEEWNSKFIISETECGIHWIEAKDYSEFKDLVTCKKCLKKIEKNLKNDSKRKSG